MWMLPVLYALNDFLIMFFLMVSEELRTFFMQVGRKHDLPLSAIL